MNDQDVWQPIATIPKDGSIVRGLLDDGSDRGWAPVLDREVDGLLRGTGYELRRVR